MTAYTRTQNQSLTASVGYATQRSLLKTNSLLVNKSNRTSISDANIVRMSRVIIAWRPVDSTSRAANIARALTSWQIAKWARLESSADCDLFGYLRSSVDDILDPLWPLSLGCSRLAHKPSPSMVSGLCSAARGIDRSSHDSTFGYDMTVRRIALESCLERIARHSRRRHTSTPWLLSMT
jgi:hypothetical protein